MTREQVRQLIAACLSERDQLLVHLAWETGGRISELLGVTRRDLDLKNRQVRLRTLKKPKDRRRRPVEQFRWIPIHDGLAADFGDYLTRAPAGDRLFPISRVRAFEIVREAAERAGLEVAGGRHISPHILRHSFAVNCLNQGVPINIVKELLGHASILTTMVYLRVVPADLRVFLSRVEF